MVERVVLEHAARTSVIAQICKINEQHALVERLDKGAGGGHVDVGVTLEACALGRWAVV